MRGTGEDDPEAPPSDSSARVAWLDDDSSAERSNGAFIRAASVLVGIWVVARLLFVYVVVPCVFLIVLVVLLLVLGVHPLVGGILFALGVAFGVGFYFEEVPG